MSKKHTIRLHRIYSILLSISIIIAGICLIAGCLSIYRAGEHPYSREIVAETFCKIAVPVYICLALTVAGFVWDLISPLNHNANKPVKSYSTLIERIAQKKDLNNCDHTLLISINKEKKSRKLHSVIRTIVICLSGLIFLSYALNSSNFHNSDINSSMIHAMLVLIPCLAVSFGYAVFVAYRNEKSLQREFDLIRRAASAENANDDAAATCGKHKALAVIRIVIVLVGVAVLIYGYAAGGTSDVLTKAINICTECIGLG